MVNTIKFYLPKIRKSSLPQKVSFKNCLIKPTTQFIALLIRELTIITGRQMQMQMKTG